MCVRPDCWFGTWLCNKAEFLTENGQNDKSSTPRSIQWGETCTINVLARFIIFWIALSDLALWFYAPTLENYDTELSYRNHFEIHLQRRYNYPHVDAWSQFLPDSKNIPQTSAFLWQFCQIQLKTRHHYRLYLHKNDYCIPLVHIYL